MINVWLLLVDIFFLVVFLRFFLCLNFLRLYVLNENVCIMFKFINLI